MPCVRLTDWQFSHNDSIYSVNYKNFLTLRRLPNCRSNGWYPLNWEEKKTIPASCFHTDHKECDEIIYTCIQLLQHRNQNQFVETFVWRIPIIQNTGLENVLAPKPVCATLFLSLVSLHNLHLCSCSISFCVFHIVDRLVAPECRPFHAQARHIRQQRHRQRQLNENEICGLVRDYQWWAVKLLFAIEYRIYELKCVAFEFAQEYD